MNTQLIVYPQSYEGVYNVSYSYYYEEYLTNGQTFSGLNATTVQDVSALGLSTPQHAIQQEYAATGYITAGAWYRFKTSGIRGTTTAPLGLNGNIVFPATGSGPAPSTGVFQLLNNLIQGISYTLKITTSGASVPAAIMEARVHTNNGTQLTSLMGVGGQDITLNFQATSPVQIISINYYSASLTTTITRVSVKPTTPEITETFQDGQVICDLYEEEDIPLTLSIDEFKNVAEQVKSYSKDFNLPGTKRNNQIFDNMFEVTRDDDGVIFNPYVRTRCVLKQDGLLIFQGFIRMLDIKDKNGEISYNVNLYSEVIAFADALKDATFSNIDFSELNHEYQANNIQSSWTGDLSLLNPLPAGSFAGTPGASITGVLKYPVIDWTHDWVLGGTNALGVPAGIPELTNLEQFFRPCIQLKYLINKIFAGTEFKWSSTFFEKPDFAKLFMDFNWGSNIEGATPFVDDSLSQEFSKSGGTYWLTQAWTPIKVDDFISGNTAMWDNSVWKFTSAYANLVVTGEFQIYVKNLHTGSRGVDYIVGVYNSAGQLVTSLASNTYNVSANTDAVWTGTFATILQAGQYIQMNAKTHTSTVEQVKLSTDSSRDTFLKLSYNTNGNGVIPLLNNLRGELNQWDFIKGIMTMFNLVSFVNPNTPNTIIIETYNDVFLNNPDSTKHDWTNKIDVSEINLRPLQNEKKTILKFVEDDDDYAFNVYKQAWNGRLYGSAIFDESLSGFGRPSILQGENEIEADPFASTVCKPIIDTQLEFIAPAIYAMNEDGTSEGFDNSPRIFYDNGVMNNNESEYYVPEQGGVSAQTLDWYLRFTHLSVVPSISATTIDFVFESQGINQLGLGVDPINNLFTNYWLSYLNQLYSPNTRIMTLKVNLNASEISNFKFIDTVIIKNRTFRVNKIDYKPNDLSKIEFILIP